MFTDSQVTFDESDAALWSWGKCPNLIGRATIISHQKISDGRNNKCSIPCCISAPSTLESVCCYRKWVVALQTSATGPCCKLDFVVANNLNRHGCGCEAPVVQRVLKHNRAEQPKTECRATESTAGEEKSDNLLYAKQRHEYASVKDVHACAVWFRPKE